MLNMSNVDPSQIHQFNAIADTWWDKLGQFKPLHDINPLRLQFMQEQLNDFAHKKIVDIGCGGGILSESMAILGADVVGIDLAEQALAVAVDHARANEVKVDYQCIAVEDFAEQHAGKFDVVTCMEMLEHVPDPASIIEACQKLIKPDGWVFLSTLNRTPKAFLMAIVGAEHILKMIPKGTHEYKKFIKPSEMLYWCRQSGLMPEKLKGMTYHPLSKQYTLSDDLGINYLVSLKQGL